MPNHYTGGAGLACAAETGPRRELDGGSHVAGEFALMRICSRAAAMSADATRWRWPALMGLAVLGLAGCAHPQQVASSHGKEYFPESQYGAASPKVVEDGQPVPRGGGQYLVGHPYRIAGRTYVPAENPNYSVTGMASWYGDAFHGRRTANGEVYDKNALSAAHPTMPLPSYARVTNTANGYSVIVRVNDRGPYHGGRVMDVSSRVADVLGFKATGTGRVKVEYMGRAPMEGSDDDRLLASLRTDGSPARLNGYSAPPTMVADDSEAPRASVGLSALFGSAPTPAPRPKLKPTVVAAEDDSEEVAETAPPPKPKLVNVPSPPERPFDLGAGKRVDLMALASSKKPPLRLNTGDRALYFAPDRRPANDPFAKLLERTDAQAPRNE